MSLQIEQWIDMDGEDFKRLEDSVLIRKIVNVRVETGIIKIDNAGYMWEGTNPVHAELDGKFVGLRYAARALN